jgi:hypothetical protein
MLNTPSRSAKIFDLGAESVWNILHKCMSRIVAVLVVSNASPAKVIIKTISACDKVLGWQF